MTFILKVILKYKDFHLSISSFYFYDISSSKFYSVLS